MASDSVVLTALFLHVLLAAAWVGQTLSINLLALPMLKRLDDAARRAAEPPLLRRHIKLGNALGGLTMLSGLALLLLWEGNLRFEGDRGRMFAFGFVANLLALYLLNFAFRPSQRRLEIMAPKQEPNLPPSAQTLFFRNRLVWTAFMMNVLLLLAVAAMVWARWIA
jgi:hypothetical protein